MKGPTRAGQVWFQTALNGEEKTQSTLHGFSGQTGLWVSRQFPVIGVDNIDGSHNSQGQASWWRMWLGHCEVRNETPTKEPRKLEPWKAERVGLGE